VSAQSQVKQAYPAKDIWFTECTGTVGSSFAGDLAWNAENLLIGATRNWARGVTLWNIALDQNSGPQNGGCTNCRGVVTVDDSVSPPLITRNVEYYVLGHLGKFVQPGAYRIDSNTYGSGSLEDVAFQNPDGSVVLLVLNAASGSSTFAVTWNGSNFTDTLPAGAVATYEWAVPAPAFPADGAINAAAPQAALSPGELFSIYGVNLAAQAQQPLLLPLPATMAAASVQIDGYRGALGLRVAAADQRAGAVGSDARQRHPDRYARRRDGVADGHDRRGRTGHLHAVWQPAAAALNQDYSVNSQDNPASAQAILLFGTGLGAVSPAVPTGAAASGDTLSQVIGKRHRDGGWRAGECVVCGPGAGVCGIVADQRGAAHRVSSGAVPVIVSVPGVASNTVTVWVE
jgi:hypothetical protein